MCKSHESFVIWLKCVVLAYLSRIGGNGLVITQQYSKADSLSSHKIETNKIKLDKCCDTQLLETESLFSVDLEAVRNNGNSCRVILFDFFPKYIFCFVSYKRFLFTVTSVGYIVSVFCD